MLAITGYCGDVSHINDKYTGRVGRQVRLYLICRQDQSGYRPVIHFNPPEAIKPIHLIKLRRTDAIKIKGAMSCWSVRTSRLGVHFPVLGHDSA